MDPPSKKWHLTWQFLMVVTRKEGFGWEADLAAHVSDSFFINLLLVLTFCHITCTRKPHGSQVLKAFLYQRTLPSIRSSQDISFSCPLQILLPGITCLDALLEL